MTHSETVGKLASALVAAQAELRNPAFDSENPHFRSRFVSLAALRDAVLPVLNRHGLAVVQALGGAAGGITCETVLLHSSGEWIADSLAFPAAKADPQGYAAASTYARRYGLQSMVAVVGDEDDDGNRASAPIGRSTIQAAPRPVAPAPKPSPVAPPPEVDPQGAEPEEAAFLAGVVKQTATPPHAAPSACISDAQRKMMFALLWAGSKKTAEEKDALAEGLHRAMFAECGVEHTEQIPRATFNKLLAALPQINPACQARVAELLAERKA